ncbi:MAG: hypothetical protein IJ465_04855 [Clostridia bacterium]|nr:hypothetical protein [Clostridia bacterium]
MRRKPMIACLVAICLLLGGCAAAPAGIVSREVTPTVLGQPQAARYAAGETGRNAWDMAVFNDKLYVGGGDYDSNLGPVDIWCYDFSAAEWQLTGNVPDEEISRFTVIDGRLIAPGIDPRQSWQLGNYYTLTADGWETTRSLPGGIHVYDMAQFDGKLFAALGVVEGEFPVAVSSDGGKTFQQLPLVKDGAPLQTAGSFIRVYRFLEKDDALYAFYYNSDGEQSSVELYWYENGAFAYYADWQSVKRRGRFGNVMIAGAETVGDTLYFATGKLYAATDMAVPLDVTPSADAYTPDLTMAEDTLCVLACEPQDETYRVSVWTLTNGKLVERFYFSYAVPAVSLAYREGVFYLGVGSNDKQNGHTLNGTVLAVEFPLS